MFCDRRSPYFFILYLHVACIASKRPFQLKLIRSSVFHAQKRRHSLSGEIRFSLTTKCLPKTFVILLNNKLINNADCTLVTKCCSYFLQIYHLCTLLQSILHPRNFINVEGLDQRTGINALQPWLSKDLFHNFIKFLSIFQRAEVFVRYNFVQ